jgi:hypothetical protein
MTMAAAAAGGGLLIAAAGAIPAYASAPAAPATPAGGNTITITAQRTAHAASGIGPHDVLPCAVKPGATPAASCGGETIRCTLSAGQPSVDFTSGQVRANALVQCTDEVDSIRLTEHLLQGGISVSTDSVTEPDSPVALTQVATMCQIGTYVNVVDATITVPSEYVLTGGANPMHFESAPVQVLPFGCTPGGGGGGGGGGGCAMPAPSLAGHPAGRHPDLITCQ